MNIHAVSVYWNPAGSENLRENAIRFEKEFRQWGIPLTIIEAVQVDQLFPNAEPVPYDPATNCLWQKERLINYAVERLPASVDVVAWVDMDILFLDRHWVEKAAESMKTHRVAQLFRKWLWADANGYVMDHLSGIGENASHFIAGERSNPGGALIAHRDVFPLYEHHICGGGDSAAMLAWTGQWGSPFFEKMSFPHRRHCLEWAAEANAKVRGKVTDIDSGAVHLFHGTRHDRKYWDRHLALAEHHFHPDRDVIADRLLEWTPEAPEALKNYLAGYFRSRNEDSR